VRRMRKKGEERRGFLFSSQASSQWRRGAQAAGPLRERLYLWREGEKKKKGGRKGRNSVTLCLGVVLHPEGEGGVFHSLSPSWGEEKKPGSIISRPKERKGIFGEMLIAAEKRGRRGRKRLFGCVLAGGGEKGERGLDRAGVSGRGGEGGEKRDIEPRPCQRQHDRKKEEGNQEKAITFTPKIIFAPRKEKSGQRGKRENLNARTLPKRREGRRNRHACAKSLPLEERRL